MSNRHIIEDGMGFAGLVGGGCRDCASYEKEIERLKTTNRSLHKQLTRAKDDRDAEAIANVKLRALLVRG